MKTRLALAAVLLAASAAAPATRGEPETHVPPTASPTFSELPAAIALWAGGPPGSAGQFPPELLRWENWETTWYPVVSRISNPSIIPYLPPPEKATGAAVVICPGGGHRYLALEHEGDAVGRWLSAHGVAGFVLKYRLAREPGSPYEVGVHALMDAQRAIRTVRSRAKEWSIDPAAVGIMGFSAGGEVALLAATQFDSPVKGSGDAVDALDCRPDFQAIFYPGMPRTPLTLTRRTPPAFLCSASDDGFQLTTPMVRLYLDLEAVGVPTEMHVYARGGHGFGIREQEKTVYTWMPLFMAWLGDCGLTRRPSVPGAGSPAGK
ncbi:MAG TPA: alpha/beta hydrolase [Opitutaceae bacterium]|nr:alpha/beta hydrolase [Opitutaceae bacterium]